MTVTVTNKTMNKTPISVFAPKHGSSNFDACTSVNQAATSECLKQKFVLSNTVLRVHAMVDVGSRWIESLLMSCRLKVLFVGLTLKLTALLLSEEKTNP